VSFVSSDVRALLTLSRWERLVTHVVPSAATHITADASFISVSTMMDSLHTFHHSENHLQLVSSDNCPRRSWQHVPFTLQLDTTAPGSGSTSSHLLHLALHSDKDARLAVLLRRHPTNHLTRTSHEPLMHATLPRSLLRLRHPRVAPTWADAAPRRRAAGVLLGAPFLGTSADGAVFAIDILDRPALRLLRFLEALARVPPEENHDDISHTTNHPQTPDANRSDSSHTSNSNSNSNSSNSNDHDHDDHNGDDAPDPATAAAWTAVRRAADPEVQEARRTAPTQVDGDALAGLLERGARARLERLLRRAEAAGAGGIDVLSRLFAAVRAQSQGTAAEGRNGVAVEHGLGGDGEVAQVLAWVRKVLGPVW
jgi:hypothetical protein